LTFDTNTPVPYWKTKKYILIPPNIHKEMCKKMTRMPITV